MSFGEMHGGTQSCVTRRGPYCTATAAQQRRSRRASVRKEWRKDAGMTGLSVSEIPKRQRSRQQPAAALSFATASCY
jgi:hypothetical protein